MFSVRTKYRKMYVEEDIYFFMENYEAVTLSSSLLGVRNGHKYGDISSAGWETGGGRVDLSRN